MTAFGAAMTLFGYGLLELCSALWVELAMFAAAAAAYIFIVGGVPIASRKSMSFKVLKAKAESEDRLSGLLEQHRRKGWSVEHFVQELRAAAAVDALILPALRLAPQKALQDGFHDLAESLVIAQLELGQDPQQEVVLELLPVLIRSREYGRVIHVGERLPAKAPAVLMLFAAGLVGARRFEDALEVLRQVPGPSAKGTRPLGLPQGTAAQLLALASRSSYKGDEGKGALALAVEELNRLNCLPEQWQLEAIVAKAGSPSKAEALREATASLILQQADAPEGASQQPEKAPQPFKANAASEMQRQAARIKAFAKDKNLPGAEEVFARVSASGVQLTAAFLNCFLDACMQCGAVSKGTEHFEMMKGLGLADVVGYNTLLKGLLHEGRSAAAKALVEEMNSKGISANKVTYNELLHSKVLSHDRRGVWQHVEEMSKAGLKPNAVTCSILLKSISDKGSSEQKVKEDLLRVVAILDDVEEPMDEVLMSSVIDACLRLWQLDLLTELLAKMRRRGSCPALSAPTYGSMIKAYGHAGQINRVRELWSELEEQLVSPTSVTIGCVVEALVVNQQPDEALALVHRLLQTKDSRHVNTVIYSTLIKGFATARRMDKVLAVYEEMRSKGIPCNTITYNTLLDACAKSCNMNEASKLLEDMRQANVEPDTITYSSIVKGYCQEGDVDRAFMILEEMKRDGKFSPDEITYNSLLDGCSKNHRVEDAIRLLEEMDTLKVKCSNYTLSITVKILGHARRLNQAFQIVEDMSKKNHFKPNVQVYTCLAHACVLNRSLDKALLLLGRVEAEACRVDEKFYGVLVKGCLTLQQPQKAVEVVKAAYPSQCRAPVGVELKTLEDLAARLQVEDKAALAELTADLERHGVRLGASTGGRVGRGPADRRQAGGRQSRQTW